MPTHIFCNTCIKSCEKPLQFISTTSVWLSEKKTFYLFIIFSLNCGVAISEKIFDFTMELLVSSGASCLLINDRLFKKLRGSSRKKLSILTLNFKTKLIVSSRIKLALGKIRFFFSLPFRAKKNNF